MAKGKKTGGGSRKGRPNKATAEIRELAREYAPDAITELARLAKGALSEAARVSAIKEILDRGYGKPTQPLDHGGTTVEDLIDELDRINATRAATGR